MRRILKRIGMLFALGFIVGVISIVTNIGAAELPQLIVWTSYDVGTSTYVQTACMADGVTKKTGLRLRVMPSGNDIARLLPLQSGSAHFATMSGPSAYSGMNGLWDYAKYNQGPQPFRQVLSVIDYEQAIAVGTAATAKIKNLKDLKGKRLTYIPGGTALNSAMEATLAFAGLTWDDVVKVPAPSLGTSMKFLGEGKADAAWASTTSPAMLEVARTPYGVYWPEYPTEDKAGWERMLKVAPYFIPVNATKGVGVSPKEPRRSISYAYPIILTYDKTDENLVYEMTKAIDLSFDNYKSCHMVMPCWDMKKAITTESMLVPYHAGTIRYLKGKKLWTEELEIKQAQLLQKQDNLKRLWNQVLHEARAKKVSEEDLADFWTKKWSETVK